MGLKSHKQTGPIKIDIAGIFTMILGVVSLLLALTFGGKDYAWDSWQIIGLFALAVLVSLALLLLKLKTKAEEPIYHFRTFTILNAIGFFMSIGMFGAIMFVPFFMQGIVGVSAAESGTIMTP